LLIVADDSDFGRASGATQMREVLDVLGGGDFDAQAGLELEAAGLVEQLLVAGHPAGTAVVAQATLNVDVVRTAAERPAGVLGEPLAVELGGRGVGAAGSARVDAHARV